MDRLKKTIGPVRTSFTRILNPLLLALEAVIPDKILLEGSLEQLKAVHDKLADLDEKINQKLIDDSNSTEEQLTQESVLVEEYQKQWRWAKKRKFKLPKLEWNKFGGEIKDWLGFWGQFGKINDDESIAAEDKFQYLIQATVAESRARELVESYPPTAGNYPKVIESLKARFGREDLLVEVYVRELLKLVIQNVSGKTIVSRLYDKLESHLRALESIGVTSDKYASMLYPLVESCLPEEILRAWQRSSVQRKATEDAENPAKERLSVLMDFLRSEVEGEERISLAKAGFGQVTIGKPRKKQEDSEPQPVTTAAGLFTGDADPQKKRVCVFCGKGHESEKCFSAQKMSLSEKKGALSAKRGCFRCMKVGHLAKFCPSKVKCVVCGKGHLVIMCPELLQHKDAPGGSSGGKPAEVKQVKSVEMANLTCSEEVILPTLIVRLCKNGKERLVRAVIDTASQRSYILKGLIEEMNLKPINGHLENVVHLLFGGAESAEQQHLKYQIRLRSLDGSYSFNFIARDQESICGRVPLVPRNSWLNELRSHDIRLTDDGQNPEIQILIGANVAGKILTGRVQQLECGPTAVETGFGWTVIGEVEEPEAAVTSTSMTVTSMFVQEARLSDLWALDTIGIKDPSETKSKLEIEKGVQKHFLQTVKVEDDGRYKVDLPWIEGHPPLKTNRFLAEKRLENLVRKLTEARRLSEYDGVFQGWLETGIIEVVPMDELELPAHYLPHRAVFNPNSKTTPVRPVFDASAHERDSPSLNDCLEKGPNLIELIPSVMMQFREHRYGVVSDIKKAFLQISVEEKARDYLRFLLWDDVEKVVKVYRHKRVVFGVNCSPFLLAAVINHHLEKAPEELKAAAVQLTKSLYVDNCLTSVPSVPELGKFCDQAIKLMNSAKFELVEWKLTLPAFRLVPGEPSIPVLGMLWNNATDLIRCDTSGIHEHEREPEKVTKRQLLSLAHRVFDPIGFTAPALVGPKRLLQQCWGLKVGWDVDLPVRIKDDFNHWRRELPLLEKIEIPRCFSGGEPDRQKWTLHTFCDASKSAYAAAVFLRVETQQGVSTELLQAKARVSPLKETTIPRLELLACCIGGRLAKTVRDNLGLDGVEVHFWSDSTTALNWIKRNNQWATFVGNRVREICSLTLQCEWRHVPGALNPADLPSRGCGVKGLLRSKWWEGPEWLRGPKSTWPSSEGECDEKEVNSEKRKTVVPTLLCGDESPRWYMAYFSSYAKVLRLMARVLRFLNGIRKVGDRSRMELSVEELGAAERKLWLLIQREAFGGERAKRLHSMLVVKGDDGLFRLKTKVASKLDTEDFRYPVILPGSHPLVAALIREEHLSHCHAGVQILTSILRERVWILQSRRSIRKVVSACVRCRRFDSKSLESVPIPLPLDRVRDATVFEFTGVDLAGPLYLKGKSKVWILLCTCAVYRVVHLELVGSLSTDSFWMAFRRFVDRRERPRTVYSDNGTNFVGAANALTTIDWAQVENRAADWKINWKFNPPAAPWWGGWWERLIRVTKQLLRRVLGNALLNFEELYTVLCDCEAIVNSRPITYLSDGFEPLVALTPSMFLKQSRREEVPDLDILDSAALNKRVKYLQNLRENLRQRFRKEYLGQLVHRGPGCKAARDVKKGDVVLIGSDNLKRVNWPMGRVIETFPGKDKHVRVVKFKTSSGEFLRPIQRVYHLEVRAYDDIVSKVPTVKAPVQAQPERVTRSGRKVVQPVRFSF